MLAAVAMGGTTPEAPASHQKKTSSAKKGAVRRPSPSAQPGAASVRRPGSSSASAKTRGKSATTKKATTWRNRQLSPTSDRYREIQQALVSKGYLQADQATGVWDQNSTDAMKRFQSEQNIDASGKLNSLSLIALGLGPKRDAPAAASAAPDLNNR
jgi:hypothetical protein